jgi:hypothetical protein
MMEDRQREPELQEDTRRDYAPRAFDPFADVFSRIGRQMTEMERLLKLGVKDEGNAAAVRAIDAKLEVLERETIGIRDAAMRPLQKQIEELRAAVRGPLYAVRCARDTIRSRFKRLEERARLGPPKKAGRPRKRRD